MWRKLISGEYVNIVVPPQGAIGFIYIIEFLDGYSYIGRKNFWSIRKRKFGKKESALVTDKRKKLYEMVTKESDWQTYKSSNKTVVDRINNGDAHIKTILNFAYNKKQLSYLEESALFEWKVLETNLYYNDNICGRYFTKDVGNGNT